MPRDTDADWTAIADTAPYYGVLTQEKFRNPNPDDIVEFFAGGEFEIGYYLDALRRNFDRFGAFEPKSALDFGCGVGRLAIPLAKLTGCAVGVDIAEGMLSLARLHAERTGVNLSLRTNIPPGEQFDWVNTTIVLQHIPPARGYQIIADLWSAVADNGCLSLQITAYKDRRILTDLTRDVDLYAFDGERSEIYTQRREPSGAMSMYDYNLSRVFAALNLRDTTPVYMEATDHGGCHGFRIFVRKV